MNTKKSLVFVILAIILVFSCANFTFANPCSLNVSLVNQDPYPATPHNYVKVVFQLSGLENPQCKGAMFQLVPTYPFSLDENESLEILDGSTWIANYKRDWMIPYAIRIDKETLDGDYDLTVKYGEESLSITESFSISIEDSRTAFDAVIQESTSSEVSIAIANIGKYTANSVVVRIPEQENFRTTGTDGQMVGNLDSGDYTIVSFEVTANKASAMSFRNNLPQDKEIEGEQNNLFQFDIYYTDTLGERRIVNMILPLNMIADINASLASGNFSRGKGSSSGVNWTLIILLLFLGVVAFYIYKKYPQKTKEFLKHPIKKTKEIFRKKKSVEKPEEIPSWLKDLQKKHQKKK